MQRVSCTFLLLYIYILVNNVYGIGIPALQKCKVTLTDQGKMKSFMCDIDVQSKLNTAFRNNYKATDHIEGANKCVGAFQLNQTALVKKISAPKPKITFEDNFDSSSLDRQRWCLDVHHLLYSRFEEFVLFDDAQHITYIQDGLLYIIPKLQMDNLRHGYLNLGPKCSNYFDSGCVLNPEDANFKIRPPVHSAWIHSRDSFVFRYGRIEIRAKLPKGDWLFPYLLLQPLQYETNSQIRIAFARGNSNIRDLYNEDVGGNRLYGGVVSWVNGTRISHLHSAYQSTHFGDTFHVYTLDWKRDRIDVMVDGVCYGSITEDLERFRHKHYIVLGVSVGGHLEFLDIPKKPWQDSAPRAALDFWSKRDQWANSWNGNEALIVDYIRVYS